MSLQIIRIGVLSTHCDNVSVTFQHLSYHTQPPSSLRVRPAMQRAQADTSRSDLVYNLKALAAASSVEHLRLEHPLGHADEIRAVRQTLSFQDPHLLEYVERVQKRSLKRRVCSEKNCGCYNECEDPIMSDRSVLVVHMTPSSVQVCNYRHGCRHGSCLGHFIHCELGDHNNWQNVHTNETLAV